MRTRFGYYFFFGQTIRVRVVPHETVLISPNMERFYAAPKGRYSAASIKNSRHMIAYLEEYATGAWVPQASTRTFTY